MNDFPTFWAAYPRKVARKAAERAWAKLRPAPALVQTILSDLERRKASEQWTKQRGQFVPYPASYLNGARWEDEDEAAAWIYDGLAAFARDES